MFHCTMHLDLSYHMPFFPRLSPDDPSDLCQAENLLIQSILDDSDPTQLIALDRLKDFTTK